MVDIVIGFLAQADAHRADASVEHLGTQITYGELAALSRRVANALHSTVGQQPKVFLATAPSAYAYAGMIGTLMMGGTFCPIDTTGPSGRNAEILHAFKPDVLLYSGTLSQDLISAGENIPTINLGTLPGEALESDILDSKDNEVAYVVFTSGSTGRPKGVRIARKAFSHFVDVAQQYFRTQPGERWGQYSNLGYDIAIMDVFMALCHGATLVTLAAPTDRLFPARAIRKYGINIWQSVPSVIDLMLGSDTLDKNLQSLRVMSFCGEPLLSTHLDTLFRVHPGLVVFNTYGATETTGFNTLNCLTVDNYRDSCKKPTVALGNDVLGWTIMLVDGPSPQEGQIVVCGDNLSLGYWEDDSRTAASFRELCVDGQRVRAYFTGDWGERVGHHLYFRGRIDRQIKVKGERIELNEIDFRLRELGFQAVASILKDEAIYSFVETSGPVDEKSIRDRLADYLPFHAIPKRVLPIGRLPRNQNGKIEFAELQTMLAENRQNE
jgi:D-alanine--poly(phosphoribitol) ligase subunit 1